jgi:hypothetical protein
VLCRCTVVVPYEWVWIVESCLILPAFVLSMTSWSNEYGFHSSLFFALNPHRSSKMWIGPSLVWCLSLLDFIPLIPDDAMSGGSEECESRSLFWIFARCFSRCLLSFPASPSLNSRQIMASELSLAAPFGSRQSKWRRTKSLRAVVFA